MAAATHNEHLLEALAAKSINKSTLQETAVQLAVLAQARCADADAQRAWCVAKLTTILEHFENKRAVLGLLADLPLSSRVEKWAIRKLVEFAFLKVTADDTEVQPLTS